MIGPDAALQASTHGKVVVRTSLGTMDGDVMPEGWWNNDLYTHHNHATEPVPALLYVEVVDDGDGFSCADTDDLFRPFYESKTPSPSQSAISPNVGCCLSRSQWLLFPSEAMTLPLRPVRVV